MPAGRGKGSGRTGGTAEAFCICATSHFPCKRLQGKRNSGEDVHFILNLVIKKKT